MKALPIFSLVVAITLIVSCCFAQEKTPEQIAAEEAEIAAKITPEAIDARIAEIRMGNIIVKTKKGAEVKIEQVRHEFLFGAAVHSSVAESNWQVWPKEDREKYLEVLAENFNYAVHENALKWYSTEYAKDSVNYAPADEIWELCNERNISMRGHCIFWEKDKYAMDWLKALNTDELRKKVIEHAIDVTRHFKGRIDEFDLNNEMISGDFFRRRLGYGVINEMAYAAKFGNPDVKLFVNDYGVLADGGYNVNTYIMQIQNLLASGVPIDGIGIQGHTLTSDENDSNSKAGATSQHIQKTLDKFAAFNMPIKITECLFGADTEEGIAEELNRIFPILFAQPKVEAIIMWGFWAKDHWQPKTAMWREDWTPTPQAEAYRNLIFNKWWTKTSGKADNNGEYKTRAFYGDYLITSGGKTQKVKLNKKDGTVIVEF
ncbi:MAG: endo-1,4-beta-xylanase [Candidatus Ratteibacteria bacterium]|nr:endo-1,4-beta-xylanase [Candidatus Ratteibacteria bacterium]